MTEKEIMYYVKNAPFYKKSKKHTFERFRWKFLQLPDSNEEESSEN